MTSPPSSSSWPISRPASTRQLPDIVVQECKRDILDSLGVALAGIDHPRGRIGVEMGRRIGTAGDATIIGTGERTTVYGAAFANSELLNALDADSVLLPGHVARMCYLAPSRRPRCTNAPART